MTKNMLATNIQTQKPQNKPMPLRLNENKIKYKDDNVLTLCPYDKSSTDTPPHATTVLT